MKNLDDSFEIKVSERLFFFLSKKSKNKTNGGERDIHIEIISNDLKTDIQFIP